MQSKPDFNDIKIYLLRDVLVTFADGTQASGGLNGFFPDSNEIQVGVDRYSLDNVSDIEKIGKLDYHTYAADAAEPCELDGLHFGLDKFADGTDFEKIVCGEFLCVGACHLTLQETKICVKDIRILSYCHEVYEPAQSKTPYIYVRKDAQPLIGILQNTGSGYGVQTLSGETYDIALDQVEDIIRIPLTNEFVIITDKAGNQISGTVSAANDSMVVLINESVQVANLADIKTIRYRGTVSTGTVKSTAGSIKQIRLSLGVKDESFLCKIPYFRSGEDEEMAEDGAIATFVPGVTDRGLIAKDVVVESRGEEQEEKTEMGIIVIAPTQSRTIGYIGQEFITKTYSLITHCSMPRGNVTFTADQLSFQTNPRYVYIVRYSYNDQAQPLKAKRIELVESYPVCDYAKLWFDAEGVLRKIPVSVLYLDKFLNHTVEVLLNTQERYSGNLSKVTEAEICVTCDAEQRVIKTEDIACVFYRGTVTAYQPNNGTGFINGQYWFHVNNFADKDQILHLEVGSSVKFTFEASTKGNMCAATGIELAESAEKRGYVLKFVPKFPAKGYGFIIEPELLEERLQKNDKSGTVYFREVDIENPTAFKVDTGKSYYSVTYTEGENNTAYNVRFLEEHPFKAAPAPVPAPKPAPVPVAAPVLAGEQTKVLSISDIATPTEAYAGAEYTYGLINIFSSHYALINPQYFNRTYAPDAPYDINQSVIFNPEEATVLPDARLKTAKNAYLVRYVQKGTAINTSTGAEQPTIDYSYPIEVVYVFPKKQCTSILVDGETVTVKYAEITTPQPQQPLPKPTDDNDDAPEFILGESVYLKLKDATAFIGVFAGETDEAYLFSDGKNIEKDKIDRLFRFGVITALNLEGGTTTVNNMFDVSLSVAESKMVSILKNQKNLVRLHVMYSCMDGKITEICRVSKKCLSYMPWDAGVVTEFDSKMRNITVDSSITHYLSVSSEGVNPYVNNGTILNRAVFVKQVFHPYLDGSDMEPDMVAMAVDVRCREEELRIQYDDGKDVYLGYRSGTISFPVLGSEKFLQERIGQTVLVAFRASNDISILEGYIEDVPDEELKATEQIDEDSSSGIREEALSLFLLQKEDIEQLMAGKVSLDPEGNLTDQSQLQKTVDNLISKSMRLAAVRIAMAYPQYAVLANADNLLRSELMARCSTIGVEANSCYGEQAFYLSTLLRYPAAARRPKDNRSAGNRYSNYDCLYRLFAQDFESREQLVKFIQTGRSATKANLIALLSKQCLQVSELVAHIMLLDKLSLDIVCPIIRNNARLSDAIIAYAKETDDMIASDDIREVIHMLQDRYLRDKRRFSDRVASLLTNANACDGLKDILSHMQSRFLRLVCKDDCLRFERLMKICSDVLDYTNKPGFTLQEQLLQTAYREVSLLDEEIQAHPCKESTEILLSSGQIDLNTNILRTVKQNIYDLLNRLYQAASQPSIRCKVNEITVQPDVKSFWLIIENGSENENLQPAENLHIELESFTLGFTPQKHLRLTQNRLVCGDQLAVEVEFDLNGNMTDALEFGWTARYEYTTQFHDNGATTRSVILQESEQPLQLQLDTTLSGSKNYAADNPYFDPARGQPLIGKEMFFGREAEKQRILESICTDGEEKQFISGSAVIIHGQKKNGKTSLVNQIKNYIKEDAVLADKAIFLNFNNILDEIGGVELLHCFKRTFYSVIMSRFEDEICENHPDVAERMDEIGLEVPSLLSPESQDIWSVQFDKFFRDFAKMDGGKHSIILFMDEFTMLCTTILAEVQLFPEKASLNNIPNFIKTFSQYGFIQIIIGHEAMMRALDTLGVLNHTAEFAKSIEISALDDGASRALVTKPMEDKFGYDVYGSDLGEQAVERLLDLSGRNPTYLMRLCNRMFMYYTDPEKCPGTQLLLSDVNAMVQEYTGELLLSDFDILLSEDGDDTVEAEKRATYHYLKNAALLSLASYDKRTADSSEITRELSRNFGYTGAQIEKTRNILEARRVISITNGGRVKINTGLFCEYIQQKNGLK